MKKCFYIFVLILCLAALIYKNHFKKYHRVYITSGNCGRNCCFGENDRNIPISGFGMTLPDYFRKDGLTILSPPQFRLKNLKNFDYLIVFEVLERQAKCFFRFPKKKMILFLWEPPSVIGRNYEKKYHRYFSKIYTWNDALVDNKKYYKFFYPCYSGMMADPVPFEKRKKLCTLIAADKSSFYSAELYSKRKEAIDFFEKNAVEDFDFYGLYWDAKKYVTYKGAPQWKDCLKDYKFCICYENTYIPGYITEKIFDAFHFGCVPVYWGASNIEEYIPDNCYIDRRKFNNYEELYTYLKTITKEQHEEYLQNIRAFLHSEKATYFTCPYFLKTIREALNLKEGS